MDINDYIKKSHNRERFSKQELVYMLSLPPGSTETYLLMAEANRISKELTGNQAEVHGQFALNFAPCPCNCKFCSFARSNGLFKDSRELSVEQAVLYAKKFENSRANAVLVMTTADYDFGKFIEISKEIKKKLNPDTTFIANIGDQPASNIKKVKDSGYDGVYHAVRLREGIDSAISPETRKRSILRFQEAGLRVGTCVEPIGPEHSDEEVAELILFTDSISPAFSGAARRIPIPDTEMKTRGMISEFRMAQIVAVTRIAVGRNVKGICTHEPCTLGAIAGANLFWAESGANPRDIKERTEESRGLTVENCRKIFKESGWGVLRKRSIYYSAA